MGISTTDSKEQKIRERRIKIEQLREKHQPILDSLGVPEARFIPKFAYYPEAGSEKVIALFPSEISKGDDVYTEFVNKDYDPEDPTRTLYKWKFNPYFDTEYRKSDTSGGKDPRYYIPVSELIPMAAVERPEGQRSLEFDIPDPNTDSPLDQITIRDLVAILWKKPVSNKTWLNDIIKTQKP